MENVKRGKLKLKNGSKLKVASKHKHKKSKKKSSKRREEEEQKQRVDRGESDDAQVDMDDMTPAQRRHAKHQKKREQEAIEKAASKTYRERIEELNQYLGSLTEHHDVPRVSAAGNG
ncbi:hypothetical protein PF005_g1087 [Phytophthora fragariae]|uniref:FAM32A-like n=2 Tax=Phytophthora TaxID=4783 RepID=A0A6A4EY48_9STRA|nr:hypothetical protein PF003_g1390 [Phytophthora fragariae]KAE9043606.1 hypothetical protein PR002_g3238 [Phytophthora rubi]KAE8949260.1 hypothetical protein PF009_g1195 [Phytophthora fragariae]KAE9030178.1 hypothetical protein PF011_g733 [Phytophthora fragariae]KAE9049576.1 hypothetical protein PR001_g3190 [Phytophthora rubi]